MSDYLLRLVLDGQEAAELAVSGGAPADLAAAVHGHARPRLGSRSVDVRLDAGALSGSVWRAGTRVGSFTLEAAARAERPDTVDAPDHVAHGFTVRDLDRAARAACAADRTLSSDMATRYDIAWSAIAEYLVVAVEAPARSELVQVGWQAIYRDVKAVRRLYGVDGTGRSGEVASAPRFAAYWRPLPCDPEEGLVDRLAVYQVLSVLRELDRAAVVALAVHGDYQRAADALGIRYEALVARIGRARRVFRATWFAPETAPRQRGTDRRVASRAGVSGHCPRGHEFTPENTIRRPSSRSRRCRECERVRDAARRRGKRAAA